jgi:asparagine synthase (glutamine-hydrolysing)
MCGISVILGQPDRDRISAMVDVQHHRGPDDGGIWMDAEAGVALGHNRLSILDVSSAGHQPMFSADGKLVLTFNGEIYNYLELRGQLSDYPFQSHTDSEVILAAFKRWGPSCVERFNGMFAFAIWDLDKRKLFCARDRLGIKPFHYAQLGKSLIIASEIKAILAAGFDAAPDLGSWADYLLDGRYDTPERTFFKDIKQLPPGHAMFADINGLNKINRYWDLPALAGEPLELSEDAASEKFLEILDSSVKLRLRSDVPVGVNLSGGLDSSSLMQTVDRQLSKVDLMNSFTVAFGDSRYDETDYASLVPTQAGWKRHVHNFGPDRVWSVAEEAMAYQEAPYGGLATLAYHDLHRFIKDQGVIVLLEAQGVDEILGGYRYFLPYLHQDLLENGTCGELRNELRSLNTAVKPQLDMLRRVTEGIPDNVYTDGTTHLHPDCVSPDLFPYGQAFNKLTPFAGSLSNALFNDTAVLKLPRVLRMNDRLGMAFGLELREPFLDHRLVEFAFRLPNHLKIDRGITKKILRDAMRQRLPEVVRNTPKRPVVTPQREWLQFNLSREIEAMIEDPVFMRMGLFDVDKVRAKYQQFRRWGADNSFFVWQWINAYMWFKNFLPST